MRRSWTPALVGVLCLSLLSRADDWPEWRGADRSEVSKETGLLKRWPPAGPKRLWLFEKAGIGFSGPAIVKGTLFTMGAREDIEYLIALNADTGEELWAAAIGPLYQNNWGDGPRATPTVSAGRAYTMGGQGALICVEADSGKEVWKTTMSELGGRVPSWGYSESVLVDGGRVVCTPGGRQGALAALDKETGKVLWRSTGFTEGAQYSSPIVAEHGGVRQYIQLTMKKLVGVIADSGEVAWQAAWPGRVAVVPTPIYHEGHVYVTSGYGVGCSLVWIGKGGDAAPVYANKSMANQHGGALLYEEHVYGYSDGRGWTCHNLKTGDVVWSVKELGKGAVCCADGMLYCISERDGTVVLANASPDGWDERGRFKLDPQSKRRKPKAKVWTHPVVANGRLYLRDQEYISCYDVKAE